jgi:hypothetical protein
LAVGQEGVLKGYARVEVLADEEVAMIEGGGVELDEELVWAGLGLADLLDLDAAGRSSCVSRLGATRRD